MRKFLTLFGREMGSYFHSPIAYVVLFFFLVLTGFNFYAGVGLINRGPTEVTVLEAFFNNVFFWFGFVLIFPLLTMRLFSEEYKSGTIEPLMTAPVGDFQVVMAKYLGALAFYVILWLPSLLYFVIFQVQAEQAAADAAGSYVLAYLMLLLIGMFYLSIGCLASALTKNQIIAAIGSFSVITLLFFSGLLSFFILSVSPFLRSLITYFSAIDHMMTFSQGLFDTRPLVWYLSMSGLMIFLTFAAFQRRRWSS